MKKTCTELETNGIPNQFHNTCILMHVPVPSEKFYAKGDMSETKPTLQFVGKLTSTFPEFSSVRRKLLFQTVTT